MKLNQVVLSALVAGALSVSGAIAQSNSDAGSSTTASDGSGAQSAALATTTLTGMLVAAKTDDATKANAFDLQTSDGKIYHITFEEKTAQSMSSDLSSVVNQQVELTGELSKTDAQSFRIASFKRHMSENTPQ